MIRDQSKGIYEKHNIVIRIQDFLKTLVEVYSFNTHNNNGSQTFVTSISVENASSKFLEGIIIKFGNDRMSVIVDNIF